MSDLWLHLLLPLSLAVFHEVKGCLECDPKFAEDVRILMGDIVPTDVPGRTHLLEHHFKEIIHESFKVSHGDKMLRVLAVSKVVKLRIWLKEEFHKLGNETWKGAFIFQGKLLKIRQNLESKVKETLKGFSEVACSEDCVVTEGPVLDCWTCLRLTTRCFKGEYCGEDNPRKAEGREIILFLILLTEIVILASAVLLFYVCISHKRQMKTLQRSIRKYVEKKVEEFVQVTDKEKNTPLEPGK